jgi:putative inorganic carbon (HCO3(-)) transporter
MSLWLFLVLNAVLLIRPEELFPELAGLRLYLVVMVACLLAAGPRLIAVLQPNRLAERPVTLCVLGVWAASVLSQLARGQIGLAFEFGAEFGKAVVYFLLLVAVIDTPARLRTFLGGLVVLVVASSGVGLLQYHGVIDVPAITPLERVERGPDGEVVATLQQLQSTGIYNDPNDLCLILVTGALAALAMAVTGRGVFARLFWLLPIGLFGYAVVLTRSRGGLLGLVVAVVVWAWGRYGWKRALPLSLVLAPALVFLAGGRQANISLGREDTAHARVSLWSDGLVSLMRNPLTGIGAGEYADEVGQVAHNSFVHAYVELGLLGGSLYLAAFVAAGVALYRVRPAHPLLAGLRPFVLAILVGYAGGTFSLSRNYVVPTYLALGLADAYLRVAVPFPPPAAGLSWRMVGRLLVLGAAGLLFLRVLTQLLMAVAG